MLTSSEFEKYISGHAEYTQKTQQVEVAQNNISALKKQLKEDQMTFEQLQREKTKLNQELLVAQKKLDAYSTILDKGLTDSGSTITFVESDLTSPQEFQQAQIQIAQKYKQQQQQYYAQRVADLERERSAVEAQRKLLQNTGTDYAHQKMESISAGCSAVIEAKKNEVIQYLTCTEIIRQEAQPLLKSLQSDSVSPEDCGSSEEKLIEQVLALKGTEQYAARAQKIDLQHFKQNRTSYHSRSLIPFLSTTGVILMIIFTLGLTPMKFITPSAQSIASASQPMVDGVVRLFVSAFAAAIFGGTTYLIMRLIGLDEWAIIVGTVVAIMIFLLLLSQLGQFISFENLLGVGNGIHIMLLFLLKEPLN